MLAAWLKRGSADRDPAPDTGAEAELARLLPLVARQRGLDAGAPPGLDAVDRATLVQRALHHLERQTPTLQLEAQTELLVRLELVPSSFSLEDALRALLERELTAFYDPASRRIVIDRALPVAARRRVLAHELVHALVDREHSLGARLLALDTSDRKAALLTLAEGDAEALVARLELAGLVPAPTAALRGREGPEGALPGVLERSLAAAYVDGRAAVQRLLDSGGFAAVDALYRAPPDGTHALLASGLGGDFRAPAPPLPDPTPPEPGWTAFHSDVLGAQTWRTVLEQWLPAEHAAELARGWDGDRLVWFQRGTRRVLVWEVRTDAERAGEVARLVSRALQLSGPEPELRTARATRFVCRAWRDGAVMGRWMGERSLIIAVLTDPAQSAQCQTLSAWTIPATQRRSESRDPGPPSLRGPG